MNALDNRTIEELKRRGMSYTVNEVPVKDADGNPVLDEKGNPRVRRQIVVSEIPEIEKKINLFFWLESPCFFEGCEELRASYKKLLDASPGNCQGCKKGRIMREYIPLVKAALEGEKNKNDQQQGHTGTNQVSGANGGGKEGITFCQKLLRWATECIKKIFDLGKREGKN